MEYVEIVREYISPELLVLVPVMYFVGIAIKKSKIKDNLIPLLLMSILKKKHNIYQLLKKEG